MLPIIEPRGPLTAAPGNEEGKPAFEAKGSRNSGGALTLLALASSSRSSFLCTSLRSLCSSRVVVSNRSILSKISLMMGDARKWASNVLDISIEGMMLESNDEGGEEDIKEGVWNDDDLELGSGNAGGVFNRSRLRAIIEA